MKKFLSIVLVFAMLLTALCFAGCNIATKGVVFDDIAYVLDYVTHTARVSSFLPNESGVYNVKATILYHGQLFAVTKMQSIFSLTSGYLDFGEKVRELHLPATVVDIDLDNFITVNLEKIVVDSANPVYEVIDGSLCTKGGGKILKHVCGEDGVYKVGKNVSERPGGCSRGNCHTYEVHPENQHFKSVDGVVYSKDGKTLVRYPNARTKEYFAIPEDVEVVLDHALTNGYLKHVFINRSIQEIQGVFLFMDTVIFTNGNDSNEVLKYLHQTGYVIYYSYTEQQFLDEMKELYGEE